MARTLKRTISLGSADSFVRAAGFSAQLRVPVNRHLTISWRVAEVPGLVLDAQRHFLQLASDWLGYRDILPAFVWVIENSAVLGHHSHIVIHVPDELATPFRVMVNRWVRNVGGQPMNKGAIKFSPKWQDENHHQAIRHLLRYVLKGIDLEAAHLLGIAPQYDRAGIVQGKRTGFSESLGPTAQERHLQAAA